MMKRFTNYKIVIGLSITGMLISMMGCSELISEDINESNPPKLYFPLVFDTLTDYVVTFKWQESNEAATRILVEQFRQDQSLPTYPVYDSLAIGSEIKISLGPGKYMWKARYENNISETDWEVAEFVVQENFDLSNDELLLLSPMNNSTLNYNTVYFEWVESTKADSYLFRLTNEQGELLEEPVTISGNSLIYEFGADGFYNWAVKGINNSSETTYIERTLEIDTEAPSIFTLTYPANDSIMNLSTIYVFGWEADDSVLDTVFFWTESFGDFELTDTRVVSDFSASTSISFDEIGTYIWGVKRYDLAGNFIWSSDSLVFQVVL